VQGERGEARVDPRLVAEERERMRRAVEVCLDHRRPPRRSGRPAREHRPRAPPRKVEATLRGGAAASAPVAEGSTAASPPLRTGRRGRRR
jgi:hypothetical protein